MRKSMNITGVSKDEDTRGLLGVQN